MKTIQLEVKDDYLEGTLIIPLASTWLNYNTLLSFHSLFMKTCRGGFERDIFVNIYTEWLYL